MTDPSLPEKVELFSTFGRKRRSRLDGRTTMHFGSVPCKLNEIRRRTCTVGMRCKGWFILRNWAHCVCDAVNAVKPPPPPQWSGAPPQNCNFPQTVLLIATQWREKGGLWLADSTSALHYVFPCFYHTGLFWFCDRHCWKRGVEWHPQTRASKCGINWN